MNRASRLLIVVFASVVLSGCSRFYEVRLPGEGTPPGCVDLEEAGAKRGKLVRAHLKDGSEVRGWVLRAEADRLMLSHRRSEEITLTCGEVERLEVNRLSPWRNAILGLVIGGLVGIGIAINHSMSW